MIVGILAGCSSVPDAVNPVEWYKGVSDLVTGQEKRPELATPHAPQGQFPDVNAMPSTAGTPPAVPEGLAADRAHSNYAGSVHRDVAPTKPLVRRPAVPEPAPVPPTPVPAVTPTPIAPATPISVAPLAPAPVVATVTSPSVTSEIARTALGPQSAPADRPNMTPPPRPDIPDQVAGATPSVRGKRAIDEQYQRRLTESAGSSVAATEVTAPAVLLAGGDETIHLVPPGGHARLAPRPAAPDSSFQVAALDFGGTFATLTDLDKKALAVVAKLYRQTGGIIRIVGLPTQAGAADDATELARANAVALELTRLGVPSAKLFVATDQTAEVGDNAGAHVFLDY